MLDPYPVSFSVLVDEGKPFAHAGEEADVLAELLANVTSGSTLSFSHCASEVDTLREYDGNILLSSSDVRYRSVRRGDYTVSSGPTIDAGESLPWHSGATDLYGRNRVIGSAVDIGCGEFDPLEVRGAVLLFR